MKRLVEMLLTIVLITALLVGGMFFLSKFEKGESEGSEKPVQTTASATEIMATTLASLPPETQPQTTPVETTQSAEQTFDTVPLYFQTDYPHVKFGNGTIATSGCSMACLAMVSSYLTETEYTPLQLAMHFGRFGKNNIERLIHGNEQMQLPNRRTDNVQEVLQALRDGKVVIAMMDDESIFTSEQHFIVLAGMTSDGKILVNDPFEPNYTADVYMKTCYEKGFGDYDIMRGFSGAWIYDKAAMPAEPFLYDASLPEQQKNRYEGYLLTDEENYILASFLWATCRKESEKTQQAVAEVILNRVMSPDFPNTVRDVIHRGEYSGAVAQMKKAEVDFPQYRAVTAAMYGPYVLPEDVYYFTEWEKNGEIWGEMGKYTFLHTKTK